MSPRVAVVMPLTGVLLASLMASREAAAHTRSTSYSRWVITGDSATVTLELSLLDSDALARVLAIGDVAETGPYSASTAHMGRLRDARWRHALTSKLVLGAAGQPCALSPGSFTPLAARSATTAYEWRVRCTGPMRDVRVRSDLLFEEIPGHVHFTDIERAGVHTNAVLTHGERELVLPALASRSQDSFDTTPFTRFVRLGAEHILSGWDHLLFVFTLLLCAHGLRQVALVLTGFTVGHSVTLALAATGHASADPASVEALIGLSIALLAVDSAWLECARRSLAVPVVTIVALLGCTLLALRSGPISALALLGLTLFAACYLPLLARTRDPVRLRGVVAALFGLIHGFGFAGALAPLSVSTPLVPLFGFNLGVELGQLAVVAPAWLVLVCARRHLGRARVIAYGAAPALAFGVALFASRAYL